MTRACRPTSSPATRITTGVTNVWASRGSESSRRRTQATRLRPCGANHAEGVARLASDLPQKSLHHSDEGRVRESSHDVHWLLGCALPLPCGSGTFVTD